MGGVYFGVKFSEILVNFPLTYVIKFHASISVVVFHTIHSHTLFATNTQVDVT